MPDIVRPLKLENPSSGGTETNLFPTETDPAEDYLGCAGVALKGSANTLIYSDAQNEIAFKDAVSGDHKLKTLKSLDFQFAQNLNPYLSHGTTTFRVLSRFIFRGTNEIATPSSIRVVLFGSSGTTQGEFRLFDLTNNQVIGTQSFTGNTITLYSLAGTNWPASQAIFEVQLRQTAGAGEARISSLSLVW